MKRKGIGALVAEVILGPILNAGIQKMDECSAELCLCFFTAYIYLKELKRQVALMPAR